jgi:uncharacterized alkaline shock family protein YloU
LGSVRVDPKVVAKVAAKAVMTVDDLVGLLGDATAAQMAEY